VFELHKLTADPKRAESSSKANATETILCRGFEAKLRGGIDGRSAHTGLWDETERVSR
jgi:hypothetical protein